MQRRVDAFTEGTFDLCVIGGGITGAGVALDAATRGWRVALIERGDFASGASSASSKLIHGGIRYLEYGHFALVHEALVERGRLLRNAPHLVQPLPFIVPFYSGQRVVPWQWRLGLTLYDLLAGRENIVRSRRLSCRQIQSAFPSLRSSDLLSGALYCDALMDDARLCLGVLQTATRYGAIVANYVEAVDFEKQHGTIAGVWAKDRMSNQCLLIRSRTVVNATGPGADDLRRMAGDDEAPRLQPTKGVHLIAPARGHHAAWLLLHPRDGRVFFVIPWYGKTLIGTTDTFPEPGPSALQVRPDEIAYLLEAYNHYFDPPLRPDEVMGTFAGLRPLIRTGPGEPSSLTREFRLCAAGSGLITALGGKYTTFRQMAETIVDFLGIRLCKRRRCRTRTLPLLGSPRKPWATFLKERAATISQRHPIATDSAMHLVHRYGDRVEAVLESMRQVPAAYTRVHAEEPDVVGEQCWQRDQEMAIFPQDFFLRRSRIGIWRPDVLVANTNT
jgi:glycerol-3-phosphate dehydrogenase